MGRLIAMLATRTFLSPQNFTSSLASIGQAYSPEFHNLVVQLCTNPPTVFDLTNMLTRCPSLSPCKFLGSQLPSLMMHRGVVGRHIMDEMDRQYVAVDDLETHLSSEYENGRLFRLSMKLAQLIDQPTVSTARPDCVYACFSIMEVDVANALAVAVLAAMSSS